LINHRTRTGGEDRRSFPWRAVFLCLIIGIIRVPDAVASSLDEAAERYRSYLIDDIGQALVGTRIMRERMKAHDLDGAKQAWIDARIGWERSEVFTSAFVPELDQQIDAWPNATHGFHGIEAKLFAANRTDSHEEADALIAHLTDLHAQVQNSPLSPQRLLNGIARLAFEIGGNKADGGESRLSGTSLNDMQSNADGIELAYRVIFSDAVEAAAPRLAGAARAAIQRLKAGVQVSALRHLDSEKLRIESEELVAILRSAAPEIGLERPTLEEDTLQ
jgi:iron uptake system EfeUOB component EfeO/EfeM